jgi:mannose-1-phosphate guanylyltransferase
MVMQAMVLTAGLGTRVRPLSLFRPKPLFPILNRPLLYYTLEALQASGARRIALNAHHLAFRLKEALIAYPGKKGEVLLSEEKVLLGTGGGIREMSRLLEAKEPILAVNGDILTGLDFSGIYEAHIRSGAPVTLVLRDHPLFNQVGIDAEGWVVDFGSTLPLRRLAFTGIQVMDPKVPGLIPAQGSSSILEAYRRLLKSGSKIRALVLKEGFWWELGAPDRYLRVQKEAMDWLGKGRPWGEGKVFAADQAVLPRNLKIRDWAVIGQDCRLEDGITLTRSVLWDRVSVKSGVLIEDSIVADEVTLTHPLTRSMAVPGQVSLW